MNQTELLEIMIVNAVEKGIARALKPLHEDLNKIKALNVKILKEQANLVQAAPTVTDVFRPLPKAQHISSTVAESVETSDPKMASLLAEASHFLNEKGELPDVDIPIGMFLKKK